MIVPAATPSHVKAFTRSGLPFLSHIRPLGLARSIRS